MSGLVEVGRILDDFPGHQLHSLGRRDVFRHKLVQRSSPCVWRAEAGVATATGALASPSRTPARPAPCRVAAAPRPPRAPTGTSDAIVGEGDAEAQLRRRSSMRPSTSSPSRLYTIGHVCPRESRDLHLPWKGDERGPRPAGHGALHLCGSPRGDTGKMLALHRDIAPLVTSRPSPVFVGLACGRIRQIALGNAIVGAHFAIVSERPQPPGRDPRGRAPDAAAAGAGAPDLPGVQAPRRLSPSGMTAPVEARIADSDAVLFVVHARSWDRPGDRSSPRRCSARVTTPRSLRLQQDRRHQQRETAAVLSAAASSERLRALSHQLRAPAPARPADREALPRVRSRGPVFIYPPEQRSDLPLR